MMTRPEIERYPHGIDIDSPRAIVLHVWHHTPDEAEYSYGSDMMGDDPTVTIGDIVFSVGPDPHEDGTIWAIQETIHFMDGGTQLEPLYLGGWAPGDLDTAAYEIVNIIRVLNGEDWTKR